MSIKDAFAVSVADIITEWSFCFTLSDQCVDVLEACGGDCFRKTSRSKTLLNNVFSLSEKKAGNLTCFMKKNKY